MRSTPKLLALVGAVLLASSGRNAAAPPPEDAQGDLPAVALTSFVPRAGLRRTVRVTSMAREAVERGASRLSPSKHLTIAGRRAVPAVCVDFPDAPATTSTAAIDTLLFAESNPASLRNYYLDVSSKKFAVDGKVVGWFTAPSNASTYESPDFVYGKAFGSLLQFALEKADAVVDFSKFDNDGPDGKPNSGDDDGKVDSVFFVHSKKGGECGGTTNIWSHSWQYSAEPLGRGGPFRTQDVRRNKEGNPVLLLDGTPATITIDDYTIEPALSCTSGEAPRPIEVGVFCHEYGHALGLPDLYDRTPKGEPDSQGTGHYCLMSNGSFGGNGLHPERPVVMSAWAKLHLGWGDVHTITQSGVQTFLPVSSGGTFYRLMVPGTDGLEYFLVEYRERGVAPPGRVDWDEFLPAHGLAIWHVDEHVGEASPIWPFAENGQGQNDDPPRRRMYPPPIWIAGHPLVYLVQADRRLNLDLPLGPGPEAGNFGDDGDLWSRGSFLDDKTGKAGSRAWSSKPTGISITDIRVSDHRVTATVTVPASSEIRAPLPPRPTPAVLDPRTHARLLEFLPKAKKVRATPGFLPTSDLLTASELKAIDAVPIDQLFASLAPEDAAALLDASRVARGRAFDVAEIGLDAAKEAVARLTARSIDRKSITARLARGAMRISQVADLAVPSVEPTFGAEAIRLLADADLSTALSLPPSFLRVTEAEAAPMQEFLEARTVGDRVLPVFDSRLTLHFDGERRLSAATADLAPATSEVSGANAEPLGPRAAVLLVALATGLAPSLFDRNVVEGVFVVAPETAAATPASRVAYRLTVAVGEGVVPIEVYLDAESRKILDIR